MKSSILKEKKKNLVVFCNTTNNTANKCSRNRNIEQIIDSNVIAEFYKRHVHLKLLNQIYVLIYFVNHWISPKFNI